MVPYDAACCCCLLTGNVYSGARKLACMGMVKKSAHVEQCVETEGLRQLSLGGLCFTAVSARLYNFSSTNQQRRSAGTSCLCKGNVAKFEVQQQFVWCSSVKHAHARQDLSAADRAVARALSPSARLAQRPVPARNLQTQRTGRVAAYEAAVTWHTFFPHAHALRMFLRHVCGNKSQAWHRTGQQWAGSAA